METLKEYMVHEKTLLNDIVSLRSGYTDNLTREEKFKLHNKVSKKLNDVKFLVENYPNLKASQNFLKLQNAWNEVEEQIAASRRFYNSAISNYNNAVKSFPSNIIASLFGFSAMQVFETIEIERSNIDAKKLFGN